MVPTHFNLGVDDGYASGVATQAGKAMKKLMRAKGLRIKDLVNLTGWSRPTVSRHVNGVRVPNYEQRQEYAKHFEINREEIDVIWRGQSPPDEDESARLVLKLSPRIYQYLYPITENTDLTIDDAAELLIIEAAERREETGEEDDTSYVPPDEEAPAVRGEGEKKQPLNIPGLTPADQLGKKAASRFKKKEAD